MAQQPKKILIAFLSHVGPAQHNAMPGLGIDGPKQDAFGIVAGNGHDCRLAAQGPSSPENRKETQDGLIFKQQHRLWRHVLQFPENGPFF